MVNTSCALIDGNHVKDIEATSSGQIEIEKITKEIDDLLLRDREKFYLDKIPFTLIISIRM